MIMLAVVWLCRPLYGYVSHCMGCCWLTNGVFKWQLCHSMLIMLIMLRCKFFFYHILSTIYILLDDRYGLPLINSKSKKSIWIISDKGLEGYMYRGAVNQFLFRHCPSEIFWKWIICNINIQYKNDWNTLQKLTKPVFAFRHWENLVSSSIFILLG